MPSLTRLAAMAASLLVGSPALAEDVPLATADVAGWWGGDAEHAGERRRIVIELAEGEGGTVARLSIPAIGVRDAPVGPWQVEGRSVRIGRSFVLSLEGDELTGALPAALVPVHRIPVVLRRLPGPERAPEPTAPAAPPGPVPAWTAELGAPVWGGLARDAAHRLVLASTDAGRVFALAERTGRVVWTAEAEGAIRARPTVDGGRVYVPTDGGYLYALDARSGRRLWRAAIGQGSRPRGTAGGGDDRYERYASSAVVAGGRVYVGSRDGNLYALDAATGRVLWRAAGGDVISGAPAVAGGAVVFGSYDGHVRAVAARDGKLRWDVDTRGAVVSDVVAAGGNVLVGTRSYELWAIDAASGAEDWRRYVWFSWIESPPAVRGGVAYHGTSDALRVFAVALDGRRIWEAEVPGWSWARPAVTESTVFVATVGSDSQVSPRQGALLALDRRSGAVRWSVPAARPPAGEWGFAAGPVVAGGRVIAADLAGRVLAFEAGE